VVDPVAVATPDPVETIRPPAPRPEVTPLVPPPPVEVTPPPAAPAAAAPGQVKIVTVPEGAAVTIDGVHHGTTPLSLVLPVGPYILDVQLAGYQGIQRVVDVTDTPQQVPIELVAELRSGIVFVFLQGRDSDALFIDGKAEGTLPGRATLSEGTHTFAVEGAAGRFEVTRDVRFEGGTLQINLAE
jgi:hypothetical protein